MRSNMVNWAQRLGWPLQHSQKAPAKPFSQRIFERFGPFRLHVLMLAPALLCVPSGPAQAEVDAHCEVIAAPYKAALNDYISKASNYWRAIEKKKAIRKSKKRRGHAVTRNDYVLTHPPSYSGPKRPKCLDEQQKKAAPSKKKKGTEIGVVADFLRAAKKEYGFVPRPSNEKEYKKIYAVEALAAGLTAEQVIGVYSLETGGIGPYYRQSGIFPIDYNCNIITPKGRAASTALGYAQLLGANSAVMVKEHGDEIAKRLEFSALMESPKRREELQRKANILRKMSRDVKRGILRYRNRNNWREFVSFSKTSKGYAVHAVNLDPDIGPLIQVRKLKKIVSVAARKGFENISSAELETLNLVGYGRGLEMMTPAARGVPTANFFSRKGYERNPVAKDVTAKGLTEKIASIIEKRKENCGAQEFIEIFRAVSTN